MTAIPCACLGIFMGGLLVKKLNLSALGAIRMAMLVNLISTTCYISFLFLGCETGPVAGVTISYDNRSENLYEQAVRMWRNGHLNWLQVLQECSEVLNVQIKIPSALTHDIYLTQFNKRVSIQ